MEGSSGTIYAMQQRISAKLLATGATSREKAVTAQEAHLDLQEINWLCYIAGGLLAKVKKTKDKRYYLATYHGT
jgi:cytidylate kinase